MKAIDITLCVQAFNFFIAYLILRHYIFYPAACILQEQEDQDNGLQEKIAAALLEKEKIVTETRNRFLQIQNFLFNATPSFIKKYVFFDAKKQKAEENFCKAEPLSMQQRQKIKNVIIERFKKVIS
ncbi:hypothetical protein HYV11_02485 [Candidatus Dependentiae bacterium]|nr:hypothetical protein [Candidatus Dependentiae bacterium]